MTLLVYIFLCLVFGTSWIAIKIGLTDAPPLYSSSARSLLSIAILFAIIAIRRYPLPRDRQTLFQLALPGLFMYGLHYALIYFAQLYIPSALTSVIFASFPMFVALYSLGLLKTERPTPAGWFGMLLGLAGIVLISVDTLRLSGQLFIGTLLALAGTASAAYGMVLHKKYHTGHNIAVAAAVQMTLGAIPVLLAALVMEDPDNFHLTDNTVWTVLYLALFGTVAVFLAYYWLLRRIRAITLSLMAFITPIIAIIVGVVFFGESLTELIFAGSGLILIGVYLVVKKGTTPPA